MPLASPLSHVLRYGDFTAKGIAGGLAGANVDTACAGRPAYRLMKVIRCGMNFISIFSAAVEIEGEREEARLLGL